MDTWDQSGILSCQKSGIERYETLLGGIVILVDIEVFSCQLKPTQTQKKKQGMHELTVEEKGILEMLWSLECDRDGLSAYSRLLWAVYPQLGQA